MDSVEKKIIMPDKSIVRYYIDADTGAKTLNIEDVVEVLKGSEENKEFLRSKMNEFVVSQVVSPPVKKKVSQKKLSEFNQKLKQAANFNPNKDKK